jgi:WD40 repeat protein
VIVSFDSWKEGHVAATRHLVSVEVASTQKLEQVSPRLFKTLVHPDRTASVVDARFFAEGTKLFAAGYPSGVVQVFEVRTGKELRRITSPPGLRGTAEYAIPSPDFRTLYVPVGRRKTTSFKKDGEKHYRFEFNGELLTWDLEMGKDLSSLETSAPGRGVLAAYLSPRGKQVVTVERASYDRDADVPNETLLWILATRTSKSLGKGYGMAAFSADEKLLAIALFGTPSTDGSLTVMDLETGGNVFTTRPINRKRGFSWPIFSPDGKILAVQDSTGEINKPAKIRLFAANDGKELGGVGSEGPQPFREVTFSPDGKYLAVPDYAGAGAVTLYDLGRQRIARTYGQPGLEAMGTAFSPDSKRLVVLVWPKLDLTTVVRNPDPADYPQARLWVFDAFLSGEPETIFCPQGFCQSLAFNPDGTTLAVGGTGGVYLFDVSKNRTP